VPFIPCYDPTGATVGLITRLASVLALAAPAVLFQEPDQRAGMSHDQNLHPHHHTYIPERDDFTSKDHGEAERYRLTREAVLRYLVEEPAVAQLFSSCDQSTGLLKLAEAVVQASDEQKPVVYEQFIERVRALPQLLKTEVAEAAVSWGLPYQFVSDGLVAEYVLQRAAIAHGFPFCTWIEVKKDHLKVELAISGHATEKEVEAVFERIRQARKPDALKPGRALMTNKKNADATATKGAHLDRNAQWLVRHHVGKIPPIDLAHEHYREQFKNLQNPVSTITTGIKSAHKLLNLTTYVIPSTPTRK